MFREIPYLETYYDEIPDEKWDEFVSECEYKVDKMNDLQYFAFCLVQYDTDLELVIMDNINDALLLNDEECLSIISEYRYSKDKSNFRKNYGWLLEENRDLWEGK